MTKKLTRSELQQLLKIQQEGRSKGGSDMDDLDRKALEGYQYLDTDAETSLKRLDVRFEQRLTQATTEEKVKTGKVRRLSWLKRVAAIGLVIVMASYFLFQRTNADRLFAEHFEPPQSHYYQATRGSTDLDALSLAFAPYEAGKFELAYDRIMDIKTQYPDKPDLLFFAAISKLASGDAGAAIHMLKECLSLDHRTTGDHAAWYLGLAYLKLGDSHLAKESFNQVLDSSPHALAAKQLVDLL